MSVAENKEQCVDIVQQVELALCIAMWREYIVQYIIAMTLSYDISREVCRRYRYF